MSSSSRPLALKVLTETHVPKRAKLFAPLPPRARDRFADAAEDDLPHHWIQVEAATGWQERKVVANLSFDISA